MIKLIARILPRFKDAIIAYGKERPYFHLKHEDGSPYMDRWWLLPKILMKKQPDGSYLPRSWLPFCIRLHHIRSSDGDRDLHDHPADYRTIILDGAYTEIDIFKQASVMLPGRTKSARAENFHRIIYVTSGGVWTIFFMSKRRNKWGFLVEGGYKLPYEEYFKNKGIDKDGLKISND